MKWFSVVLLVLFWVNSSGQNDQKLYKKSVFDKESEQSKYTARSSHSSLYVHTAPQEVPAWFSNPPASTDEFVYSIGISDPEMDSADGMQQAILRAEMMANVFWYSTTQLLCDFYMDEVGSSQKVAYEHFSRINTRMPYNQGKFEIVETATNAFNEYMVLIKYDPKSEVPQKKQHDVLLELYKNETQASAFGEFESIYEARIKAPGEKDPMMLYRFTELGKRYDVELIKEGKEFPIPIYTLGYKGIAPKDTVIENQYFTHGLWKEYLRGAMSVIITKAREKPENISYLSDNYQTESYQKLTRGISVNKMRFALVGIKAGKNEMIVQLEELPLK